MRITDEIYIVASLQLGISGRWDSHVYLVRGREGLVLMDAGGGTDGVIFLENIRREGFDPNDIKALLLTHNHSIIRAVPASSVKKQAARFIFHIKHEICSNAAQLKKPGWIGRSSKASIQRVFSIVIALSTRPFMTAMRSKLPGLSLKRSALKVIVPIPFVICWKLIGDGICFAEMCFFMVGSSGLSTLPVQRWTDIAKILENFPI